MPNIPFNVVNITAGAGGEYGIVNGKIKGDLAASIQLSADLCHGLQLGIEGEIGGLVEGKATALFVGAKLKGSASAAAGAKVLVRLEPNLFNKMGLSIDAGAYARASVAGSVAIYLTPEYFAKFVNDNLDDFTADLFLIFLEEVYAEAGLWGKAAFSAMAEGHINIVLDMQNLDAGFEISAGGDVGLSAGCGWDFYCRAGFRDLRRAILRSSLRISEEIEKQIIVAALPQANYLALGFNFTFPLITLISFDLGKSSFEKKALLTEQEVASIVLNNFSQSLQRFGIDQIVDSVIGKLTNAFTDVYYRMSGIQLSDGDKDRLEEEVQALVDLLEKGRIEKNDIAKIIEGSINIVDLIDGGFFEPLKRPLTMFWISGMLSLQVNGLLDEFYADARISSSVIGDLSTSAISNRLPDAPDFVLEEVRNVMGPDIPAVDVGIAVDYLIEVGVSDLLTEFAPDFVKFRDLLATSFGLSEGDLVEDLLNALKGQGSLQDFNSYNSFKGFVKLELLQALLIDDLIPKLKQETNSTALSDYLTDVVEPSLVVVSDYIFSKLDNILISDETQPLSGESRARLMEGMSAGCGVVVYNVMVRNILFFDQMVTDFALDNMHQNFSSMRVWLEDKNHPFFDSCTALASQSMPGAPDVSEHIDAFQVLLYDIVTSLEHITGPTIYTYARRKELQKLKRDILLSVGGNHEFVEGPLVDGAINEMIKCNIPDVELEKIRQLTELMLAISVESLEVIGERLIPSVLDFYLELTLIEFTALRSNLLEFIEGTKKTFLAALEEYKAKSDAFKAEVTERLKELDSAWHRLSSEIDYHFASDWESEIKVRIRLLGEQNIKNQGLSASQEEAALLAFNSVEWPIINLAIDATTALIRLQTNNIIATLDGFVSSATGTGTALVEFVDSIENIALQGLTGLIIGAADGATIVVNTIFPAAIEQKMQEYLANRADKKELDASKYERELEVARYEADKQSVLDDYNAIAHRSTLKVDIVTPVSEFEFIYPGSTEINIILHKFTQAMLLGEGKRLQIMLNASPIEFDGKDIEFSAREDAYVFRKAFAQGVLVDGVNILEVSWVHGDSIEDTKRKTVSFVVDADVYYPREHFNLLINYDPPGNDVDGEFMQIGWTGTEDLDMGGWLLRDKAKHSYVFPELVLKSGEEVRIYTGGSKNSDLTDENAVRKVLHMGRGKAVWNNIGDTMFLIMNESVLIYNATYIGHH